MKSSVSVPVLMLLGHFFINLFYLCIPDKCDFSAAPYFTLKEKRIVGRCSAELGKSATSG